MLVINSIRSEAELNAAYDEYADMVKRICFMYLRNQADTEDIFQNVFLKYLQYLQPFASNNHEKAWFIRVTINAAKDFLRSFHRRVIPLDSIAEQGITVDETDGALLEAVLKLPKKYKDVVYLFYYEQYTAVEIAEILHKPINTVYSLLGRARKTLKQDLGVDNDEQA